MIIATPKEIKTHEYRVGLTPSCVKSFVARGHTVLVEKDAGLKTSFSNEEYQNAGATILSDRQKLYDDAEMIIKVKEPISQEYDLLHDGQILYTYLHLAANQELTTVLLNKNITSIAYETIETPVGALPCLKPMSEIAGRLAVQEGAKYLEKPFGGRGILLGGVPGIQRGKVAILGGGVAGTNACKIAVGIGADVTILDISSDRLAYLDDIFGPRINTLYSNDCNIEKICAESDVIIGTVLVHGAKAPRLIRKEHLAMMKQGAVLVDVSIDQGGCIETSIPTTHDNPIYVIDDIVHYCVANMPGAVALSSTLALTSTTLHYGLIIAENGPLKACKISSDIALGMNCLQGKCTYQGVAESHDIQYTPLETLL